MNKISFKISNACDSDKTCALFGHPNNAKVNYFRSDAGVEITFLNNAISYHQFLETINHVKLLYNVIIIKSKTENQLHQTISKARTDRFACCTQDPIFTKFFASHPVNSKYIIETHEYEVYIPIETFHLCSELQFVFTVLKNTDLIFSLENISLEKYKEL